ncbi:DUF917 domain-containing protein [Candidatus Aerophobetes bacterium]|uniref:DUF917 domain-containing protein n=1 Tax=Aerophobetes bacterium TaxID=2030807 RepID=A0A662D6L6_UNCAE|nr:MAG: DUF917 domain-containing protein [Candidatus Aerophobetes bacterium]
MNKRLLGKRELLDIIQGATFLGTGGGGSPKSGEVLVEGFLSGKEVELVSVDEVEDEAKVVVAAGMGAPEVLLKRGWSRETVNAFSALEKVTGEKFDYVIPVETGGFNSITPMTVSVEKGIPTIDADGAGRAIPELQQTMFSINNIPVSPTALADDSNIWVVINAEDPFKMEDLARAVTTALGMQAGIVCHIMTGKEMRKAAIPGTVSKAEKVGKAIREAKESGKDPVEAVLSIVDGFVLGKGMVTNVSTETRGGFDFGKVTIKGDGKTLRVDYKNENMMAWRDGELVAMVPDGICYISLDGQPLTNADIKEGMNVAVIGVKAPDRWRVPDGFNVFRRVLEAMGYKGEYKKIEELNKR